jgi:site-specific recombinase XerD
MGSVGTALATTTNRALDTWAADPATKRLIAGWLLEYPSPATRRAYKGDLDHLDAFADAHGLPLLHVARAHLAAWAETMRRARLSEVTIGRRLSSASSFYTYCVQNDAIHASPAADLRRPKIDRDNDGAAWLTVEQATAFLRAARDHSPGAHSLAAVMLTTGARVSEVTAADVDDLTHNAGHRLLTVTRKGGKRQSLPIAPWVGVVVDTHLAGRTEGPLFTKPRSGQRMDQPAAWRLVRLLARRAGLPNADRLHPHSLRHSAITAALEAGAGLREVQTMAGHVDPRTTERYDRMRENLDKSPVYLVAQALAE